MVLNGTYTRLLFLSNNGGYFKDLLVDKRKQKLDKTFINKKKSWFTRLLYF